MNKKIPWCLEPFISLSHTTDGYYQPCCIARVDRNSELNAKTMSPLEYMNSEFMSKLRKDMLNHHISEDIEKACAACIMNEKNNIGSRRTNINEQWVNTKTIKSVEKYLKNGYIEASDLQYVNLKILGNICNLKCVMCNQNASSKIAAEFKKHKFPNVDPNDPVIKIPYNENSKHDYYQDISKILEHVDRFSLIGGEAFIHPDFKQMFDVIVNNPNVGNLNLFIITNGTELPQYVLDSAHKFKKLELNFSIDGVKQKGEYIRTGMKWSQFDNNLKRALDSDAHVYFNIALQMLNIGYLDEIYDYLIEIGINPNIAGWNNVVTYPKSLRAINLPNSLKDFYLKKYENHPILNTDIKSLNNTLEILNTSTTKEDEKEFKKGLYYLQYLDKIRNTSLLDIFPEFKGY